MEKNEANGVIILKPAGRIDHTNASSFQAELLPFLEACAKGGPKILLDFSSIEYISSVGLRVLIMAAKQLKLIPGGIAVAGLQPVVSEIFKISRFEYVLPIHDSIEVATDRIAALGSAG